MPKVRGHIGIKNESDTSTLELHFTDYIYDGFDWETWETTNMVQDTINKIKAANPTKIKMVINSLGGDVMIGLALYNYIKAHKAEKEVEIIGFAASIASIMAMCASPGKLFMAKSGFMIIHAAWSYAMGNASEIREQAENLDKITNELAGIYAQRSGKSAKHFTNLWADGDHWMTGTDAKKEGLVDELINAEPVTAGLDFKAHNFKHIPSGIAASIEKPEESQNAFSNFKAEVMNFLKTLKDSVTGAKTDKKFENVVGREEILNMVEEVLKPFAEVLDQKSKEPVEEKKPAEEKPVAEQKPAETKPEEKKAEVVEKTAAEIELENIKAENKKLKDQIAAGLTKPASEKPDANAAALSKAKVSYED